MREESNKRVRFAYLIEPPFCYVDSQGAVTGCDVELARQVLHMAGIVDIEFHEQQFSELLSGLCNNRWDMTTGLFVTEKRKEQVIFSKPIWALADGLLIRADGDKKIKNYQSIADDKSKYLGVIKDQIQHETARLIGIPEARIFQFNTYQEAAAAVLRGDIDAYASVARAHQTYINQNNNLPLAAINVPSSEKEPEYGAFGFSKSNEALRTKVNEVLMYFLGSEEHRSIMAKFNFSKEDVDLVSRN
jgi:polar amino acid transport system substrate-binding protein